LPQPRPLQLGGAEYHRGIVLGTEHSHGLVTFAVVLDAGASSAVAIGAS
jgi:hypothetical protein